MTTAPEFEAGLAAAAAAVEAMLDALLGSAPLAGETERPARLVAAMRHAVLGGGKRLRPHLAVEAARLFGAEGPGALRVAAAIEMVHCYSLAHDDLPAMDDDDLRRGRPTVHRAYDEATAILAGDALLTLAFDVLADPATDPDAAVRADLVLALARAAGVGGMVGGQILDLAAEGRYAEDGRPLALDATAITRLQSMKTGALIAVSVDAGAILGRAGPAERAALGRYGRAVGPQKPPARRRARTPRAARRRSSASKASTPCAGGWRKSSPRRSRRCSRSARGPAG